MYRIRCYNTSCYEDVWNSNGTIWQFTSLQNMVQHFGSTTNCYVCSQNCEKLLLTSSGLSVRLSFRRQETTRLPLNESSSNLIFEWRWSFPATDLSRPLEIRYFKAPDFLDFRHNEGGKVVTLTHRPFLPPGVFLVLIFRAWVDPRAHGFVGSFGKKSPATPLGIDPETVWPAAQCLNHYATPGPWYLSILPTSVKKIQITWGRTYVFIVSFWILPRMRNVSDKSSTENQNIIYVQSLFYENRTVYETM